MAVKLCCAGQGFGVRGRILGHCKLCPTPAQGLLQPSLPGVCIISTPKTGLFPNLGAGGAQGGPSSGDTRLGKGTGLRVLAAGCAARPAPALDGCCHLVHGAVRLLPNPPLSSPNPPQALRLPGAITTKQPHAMGMGPGPKGPGATSQHPQPPSEHRGPPWGPDLRENEDGGLAPSLCLGEKRDTRPREPQHSPGSPRLPQPLHGCCSCPAPPKSSNPRQKFYKPGALLETQDVSFQPEEQGTRHKQRLKPAHPLLFLLAVHQDLTAATGTL